MDETRKELKTCVVHPSHGPSLKIFVKNDVDIYTCPNCGCVMADVAFNPDQYETDSYYTMRHKTVEGIEHVWGFRWRYILESIVRIGGVRSLLDVGAGNGYFVSLAAKEFSFDANGLEISREEIGFAKEVLGIQLISEDVTQHCMQYDVVTCFNVLEHVVEPKVFLSALVKCVKPGGVLIITTPNPKCIHVRLKGLKNWSMVTPPHHINLFTKKSLTALAVQENLELINYETLSTYINFVRRFDSKRLILRKLFFNLLRISGLGADHFMVVKKPLSTNLLPHSR